MNTDLEVITLRESAQTALEVCVTSPNEKTHRYFWFNFKLILYFICHHRVFEIFEPSSPESWYMWQLHCCVCLQL